jgi:hypothetical protein
MQARLPPSRDSRVRHADAAVQEQFAAEMLLAVTVCQEDHNLK